MKTLTTILILLPFAGKLLAAGVFPVSLPPLASASAGGNSFNPIFSADGQHLVFVSHANNLVTNDDLGLWLDVFVRDLVSSNTVLVSVSTSGLGGANADANYPSISSNGQFVAFASRASNLVAGDTNGASDVFMRDVAAGITRLVSVDLNGNAPPDSTPSSIVPLSGLPLISGNGRWVFFESRATNLVPAGATVGSVNIYARDTWSNATMLVTADDSLNSLSGKSELAGISSEGRYVAFTTTNQTILPGVANAGPDVYVRDRQSAEVLWASTNVAELIGGAYACSHATLAANGSGIAFNATTLDGVTTLLMFFDLESRLTTRLYPSTISNVPPVVSADGSFVAFEAVTNARTQILLWNRASNSLSVAHEKMLGNYLSSLTHVDALSRDGRYLVFREIGVDSAYFTNTFVPRYQLFRKDLSSGLLHLVSASASGLASLGSFQLTTMSASPEADWIAFDSVPNDLAAGDRNGMSDIFLRDPNANSTELITRAQLAQPARTSIAHSFLGPNCISADGRIIVSTRYDDPSAPRDTNGWADVFVSDAVAGLSVAASINTNLYVTNSPDGGSGPAGTFVENTNAYSSPVISADGSMIYAASVGSFGRSRIYGATASNAFSSAGFILASRGINVSENGNSYTPSVSSNGQLLVFTSTSSDLTTAIPDNNNVADVYLRRTITQTNGLLSGTNELVSISLSGTAGSGASSMGFLSPDGRWVIFESTASNLVTNNTGGVLSLFARDLWSNVTHLVSVPVSNYFPLPYESGNARISGNSRYVAFSTPSSSAPPGLVMVHDLATHTSVVIGNPTAEAGYLTTPSLNHDGRYVTYRKRSVAAAYQIFVTDLLNNQTEAVEAPRAWAAAPQISGDGRFVVFSTFEASGFPRSQILVRDRLLGVTLILSANAQGGMGNATSTRPVLAADGRTVVFQSFAGDLAAGDFNDMRDLFVLKLGGVDSEPDGMDDDWEMAYFNTLARTGLGDFDGDGVSDLHEFLAGTDPTNSDSIFRVLIVAPLGGGSRMILWTGHPSRSYRAEFKDDLTAANWIPLSGTISWNGTTASLTDGTSAGSTNRYYRVVRLP